MANVYKTIGNTAAAVASLFAVGTLLWWQRSPTPIIDAPRPQDEAEIMTAILERHAAMGRTNAAFVRAIPEQTYTVATSNGTRLVTNSPAVSLTNTIGFFPNAPDRYSSAARYAFAPSWYYAGDWQSDGSLSEWIDGTGMNFDSSGYAEWRPSQEFYFDDWYQFRPSWKASAWISPVGWVSPDELNTYWVIPDNSYMENGSFSWFDRESPYLSASNVFSPPLSFVYFYIFDGTEVETYINTYCSEERRVWTNYVTKSLATWRTTTNYAIESTRTNISGTTTNAYTQTVYTVTNYINTASYDTYAHFVPDYWISAMQFAYERDTPGNGKCFDQGAEYRYVYPTYTHKQQFWSTNKYNDIGRALSLLQWIKRPKSETTNIYYYVSYTNQIFYSNAVSRYIFSPTNTGIESITVTTNYGATQPYIRSKVSDSSVGYRTYLRRSEAWGIIVLASFSNTTPFTVDTFQWQLIAPVTTNGWAGPASSRPATITGPTAPAGIGSSGWWPMEESAFSSMLHMHATNNAYMPSSETQYVYGDLLITPVYDQLQFSAHLQECYHVQFSALTNYLNHAPAR